MLEEDHSGWVPRLRPEQPKASETACLCSSHCHVGGEYVSQRREYFLLACCCNASSGMVLTILELGLHDQGDRHDGTEAAGGLGVDRLIVTEALLS